MSYLCLHPCVLPVLQRPGPLQPRHRKKMLDLRVSECFPMPLHQPNQTKTFFLPFEHYRAVWTNPINAIALPSNANASLRDPNAMRLGNARAVDPRAHLSNSGWARNCGPSGSDDTIDDEWPDGASKQKKSFPSEKSREHVLGLLMICQYLSIFISFSFRMSTPLLDL